MVKSEVDGNSTVLMAPGLRAEMSYVIAIKLFTLQPRPVTKNLRWRAITQKEFLNSSLNTEYLTR